METRLGSILLFTLRICIRKANYSITPSTSALRVTTTVITIQPSPNELIYPLVVLPWMRPNVMLSSSIHTVSINYNVCSLKSPELWLLGTFSSFRDNDLIRSTLGISVDCVVLVNWKVPTSKDLNEKVQSRISIVLQFHGSQSLLHISVGRFH